MSAFVFNSWAIADTDVFVADGVAYEVKFDVGVFLVSRSPVIPHVFDGALIIDVQEKKVDSVALVGET